MTVLAGESRQKVAPVSRKDFVFAAGAYQLTCRGVRTRVTTPAAGSEGAPGDRLLAEVARAFEAEREQGHPSPIVVGAIPFDTGQPSYLFVPEHTAWDLAGPAPYAIPAAARWGWRVADGTQEGYRAAVRAAVGRIQAGHVDKVVLARTIEAVATTPIDPDEVWHALRAANPEGFTYSLRLDQETQMMGASPELVALTRGTRLRTHPLAGSAPRGQDDEQDREHAESLTQRSKECHEHAVVVAEIADRLGPIVASLRVPSRPRPFATNRLWHLGTEIEATLKPGVSSLQAALTLHPTAAVCGQPREAAAAVIAELETFGDRGMYAGLVGWMDAQGNGTWALALRCAEIGPSRARLFAGAGIVAGSCPDAEVAETTLKLRTMGDALGLEPVSHADDVAGERR